MKFYIEFKSPLYKSVQCKEMKATNWKEVESLFASQQPHAQIIKMEARN